MAGQMAARKEARQKYQFEATGSDDELEDELDENLDETLDVTRRLKALAVAAGYVSLAFPRLLIQLARWLTLLFGSFAFVRADRRLRATMSD